MLLVVEAATLCFSVNLSLSGSACDDTSFPTCDNEEEWEWWGVNYLIKSVWKANKMKQIVWTHKRTNYNTLPSEGFGIFIFETASISFLHTKSMRKHKCLRQKQQHHCTHELNCTKKGSRGKSWQSRSSATLPGWIHPGLPAPFERHKLTTLWVTTVIFDLYCPYSILSLYWPIYWHCVLLKARCVWLYSISFRCVTSQSLLTCIVQSQ